MSKDNLYYKKYAKKLSKMVASNEFQKMLGFEVNNKIMKYSDLEGVKDLNDIMTEPKDYRIILIETQRNTGHWTTILKYNDKYFEWFDSYSLKPDAEFEFISPEMQEILDERQHILTILLNKVLLKGGKWIYNNVKFQKQAENVNSCGRWTITRLYFFMKLNYNFKQFQDFFINWKKRTNLPFDILVVEFTKVLN
jgi:hypothetical protein